jgi:hypothetical protein
MAPGVLASAAFVLNMSAISATARVMRSQRATVSAGGLGLKEDMEGRRLLSLAVSTQP